MNVMQAAYGRVMARADLFALIAHLSTLGPLPVHLRRRRHRLNAESAIRRSLVGAKGMRP